MSLNILVKKTILILISALLMLLILFKLISFNNLIKNRKITCNSSLIFYKDDIQINLFINYNLFKDDGFVDLSGSMYKSGKFIRKLNKKISFDYTKKKENYSLRSKKIESSLLNDLESKEIEGFLPAFYLKENINWSIEILKQSDSNYLFMSSSTPSFLCTVRR